MGKAARSGIATHSGFSAPVLLLALTPLPSVVVALTATACTSAARVIRSAFPRTPPSSSPSTSTRPAPFMSHLPDCVAGCARRPPFYCPEQFRFDTGFWDLPYDESVAIGLANLDACCARIRAPSPNLRTRDRVGDTDRASYVVFGYSQSAGIAALEKYDLIAHPPPGTTVSFVLNANPKPPTAASWSASSGGILPVVGVTFNGAMTTNRPEPHPINDCRRRQSVRAGGRLPDQPAEPASPNSTLLVGFLYLHPRRHTSRRPISGCRVNTSDTTILSRARQDSARC